MEFEDWDDLRSKVVEENGVLSLDMEVLRDLHGVKKLGVNVRADISDRLASLGLGHYPEELPPYQWDAVRLYQLGSPVSKLIDAVRRPTAEGDDLLRQASQGGAEAVLAQIRDLVQIG